MDSASAQQTRKIAMTQAGNTPSLHEPEATALRTALWRALHTQVDEPPHVLVDDVGLKLASPGDGWRDRPDMHPEWTRGYRASIVGRARFIEDLVVDKARAGIDQYVILGAGLDTFAQRRPDVASRMRVFEVDQPGPQAWKRERLHHAGYGVPDWLHLVPVNFEAGQSWWEELANHDFDPDRPAVIVSTGVSMYLSHEANVAMLRQIAATARGTVLAMTFLLPLPLLPDDERAQHEMVYEKARAAGTPFISFFRPEDIVALAREAGFSEAHHVPTAAITKRYFADRPDGLKPASGESFLVATV
jgi:methyltransferase (TIGR00027 family)